MKLYFLKEFLELLNKNYNITYKLNILKGHNKLVTDNKYKINHDLFIFTKNYHGILFQVFILNYYLVLFT